MKIFLDSANKEAIQRCLKKGVIDGITTNPSNLSREDGNPQEIVRTLVKELSDFVVNVEVTEREPQALYEQAKRIAGLGENVVVKIPGYKDYYAIIDKLVQEEIKINITLVFTALQGLMMAKLGVWYISPFVARLEDYDKEGMELIRSLRDIYDEYGYETEILAASLRSVHQFRDVALAGVDIATVPVEVFEQSLEHPLIESGMEKFHEDWKKLNSTQFP